MKIITFGCVYILRNVSWFRSQYRLEGSERRRSARARVLTDAENVLDDEEGRRRKRGRRWEGGFTKEGEQEEPKQESLKDRRKEGRRGGR